MGFGALAFNILVIGIVMSLFLLEDEWRFRKRLKSRPESLALILIIIGQLIGSFVWAFLYAD